MKQVQKNKTVILITCLFTVIFLTASCSEQDERKLMKELENKPLAPRDNLPAPSGDIVLSVLGETITTDQIVDPLVERVKPIVEQATYETFQARIAPQIEQLLTSEVANIILYQKARKELGEQADTAIEKAVDAEVQKFVNSFGGDYAKAELQLRSMDMDWKSFREYQEKLIISQSYIAKELPETKPITYRQLRQTYNELKESQFTTPASIQFRLIDIQPNKLKLSDPNQNRIVAAQNLVDDLYTRIKRGEDFAALAEQYSHGHRSIYGGLWQPVNPDSLAEPYDIIARHTNQMQPGQLAEPIQIENHIFIIKLEQKTEYNVQSFEEVQQQLESTLAVTQQRQAIDRLSQKIASDVAIPNRELFLRFCLQELYAKASEENF